MPVSKSVPEPFKSISGLPSSSVPLANYNQQADTGGSGDGASVCGRGFSFLRLMEKPYFPKQ